MFNRGNQLIFPTNVVMETYTYTIGYNRVVIEPNVCITSSTSTGNSSQCQQKYMIITLFYLNNENSAIFLSLPNKWDNNYYLQNY